MSTRSIRRGIAATVASLAIVGLGAIPAGATTTVAAPSAPASIVAKAQYGGVKLSWSKSTGAGVTYTVTSTPAGKRCVTTTTSCVILITDSTPWQFSVTASNTVGTSTASPLTPHYAHRTILIVAGQSNATGWESYATDPTTHVNYMAAPYTNGADTNDVITWEPWKVLSGGSSVVPLDTPQNRGSRRLPVDIFGPEIGLARQIWADKQLPVTIVKAAYPGTFLSTNWSPSGGSLNVTSGSGLFAGMLTLVAKTMTNDAKYGQVDTIGGFYWYQGEADSSTLATAANYQANLTTFITTLRADLPMSPSAPVGLVKEDMSPYWNSVETLLSPTQYLSFMQGNTEVRAADDAVAATVPYVVAVDSSGLVRTGPQLVHLTNVSELTVGQSLARATENMIP